MLNPGVGRVRGAEHEQATKVRVNHLVFTQPFCNIAPHQTKTGEDKVPGPVEGPSVDQPDGCAREVAERSPGSQESAADQVVSFRGFLNQPCDLAGWLLQVIVQGDDKIAGCGSKAAQRGSMLPAVAARSMAVTHGWALTISRRTCQLSSVLPSLTRITSQLSPRSAKNAMVCATVMATTGALLYTGMTTLQ